MSGYERLAFAMATALCACLPCEIASAAMGSLDPHDATGSESTAQQWLADQRTGCRALDPDYRPGDAVSWEGACVAGLASGKGTLTFFSAGRVIESVTSVFGEGALMPGRASAVWSNGDRYDGEQSAGQFDGDGNFTSLTGDRIEGQWKNGALDGKARVAWANGDRYDGSWANGKQDGEGTEIWANGERYQGLWREGKPLGSQQTLKAVVAPSIAPPATEPGTTAVARSGSPASAAGAVSASEHAGVQNSPKSYPLNDLLDQNLVAVDGSVLSLGATEGGLTRTVSASGGPEEQLTFAFVSDRIGTVSDDSSAIGVFRAASNEIDTDYANGDSETMKRAAGGGLLIALHAHDGTLACTSWYPPGHTFTQEEKRIAVQEYARRLGIGDVPSPKKRRTQQSANQSCGGAYLTNAASADSDPSPTPKPASGIAAVQPRHSPASPAGAAAAAGTSTSGLQNIPVRDAPVHMIDAPFDPGESAAVVQNAKFTPGMGRTPFVAPPPVSGGPGVVEPTNAAECLSVASDGQYLGFRNSCTKAVQFSYCEMSTVNPLTSCNRTSVSGSVAASGFSPLVNDESLSGQSAARQFRWMACAGGAGEVIAHLDSIEPPGGRCMRAVPTIRAN